MVTVTGIMSMMSAGEGIQHACGQFEHAIDSVNLSSGEKKRKEKGGNTVSVQFRVVIKKRRFCDDAERCVVATRERSPPPTSYKDVSRASRSTLALWMPLIPTL
jgi:hypothetical protein